jgi:hypothetical protein
LKAKAKGVDATMTIRERCTFTTRNTFAIVFALVFASTYSPTFAQATPTASPIASPIADNDGCDQLHGYFQALADLTLENEGLVIMRESAFDVLALPDDDAATVVASLDAVIPLVQALDVPDPALAWHAAQLDLLAWYRALAANRDGLDHQRLINDDRRLFSAIGRAALTGQTACGYETWNNAWSAAFEPTD